MEIIFEKYSPNPNRAAPLPGETPIGDQSHGYPSPDSRGWQLASRETLFFILLRTHLALLFSNHHAPECNFVDQFFKPNPAVFSQPEWSRPFRPVSMMV